MGSYRKAIMTSYICRLCSKYKNVVIHVYSSRAQKMSLLEKISTIPINIKKFDYLPKTICESCIEGVCRQYDLVQQIRKNLEIQMRHRIHHSNSRCLSNCPFYNIHNRTETPAETSHSDEENAAPGTSRHSIECDRLRLQMDSILRDIDNELDNTDDEAGTTSLAPT